MAYRKSGAGMDRRTFGKTMALAGSAAAMGFSGVVSPARAAEEDWKEWVASYYGKPIKMAVTCYNTTNPYFAPTKVGAEDAGAEDEAAAEDDGSQRRCQVKAENQSLRSGTRA